MSFRKNQEIVLPAESFGFRRMTAEEYKLHFEEVRNRHTRGGKYPFINSAGESVIVSDIQRTDLSGQSVKVVAGRATWDLGYSWPVPKGMMKVKTEDDTIYLVSRPKV